MEPVYIQDLAVEGLFVLFLVSLPFLAAALLTGVVAGLLSNYTKISDTSLGSAARVIVVPVCLIEISPWAASRVLSFAHRSWQLLLTVVQ